MVFRPLPGALPLLFVVVTLTALVGNAQASALVPSGTTRALVSPVFGNCCLFPLIPRA